MSKNTNQNKKIEVPELDIPQPKEGPHFTQGKLYVSKDDVWAIDFQQSDTQMQVYIRDQIFKVAVGNLIFLETVKHD